MKTTRAVLTSFIVIMVMAWGMSALAQQATKYWQDLMIQPQQEWREMYGSNPDSIQTYNILMNKALLDGQGKVIADMKQKIEALEARDANGVSISSSLESSPVNDEVE